MWDKLREKHSALCETASLWEAAVGQRTLSSGPCGDLEGWDGGGREAQLGGDIRIYLADSRVVQQKLTHYKATIPHFNT